METFRRSNTARSFEALNNLCTRAIRLFAVSPSVGAIRSLGNGDMSVNTTGSNMCFGTLSILGTNNVALSSVRPRCLSFRSDGRSLGSKGVSTTFVITNTPAATVARLTAAGNICVVGVSNTVESSVLDSYPCCASCRVPTKACPKRSRPMRAVAIGTAVMISRSLSRSAICSVATTVFSRTSRVSTRGTGKTRLSLRGTASNVAVPFRGNTTHCCTRRKVAISAGKR